MAPSKCSWKKHGDCSEAYRAVDGVKLVASSSGGGDRRSLAAATEVPRLRFAARAALSEFVSDSTSEACDLRRFGGTIRSDGLCSRLMDIDLIAGLVGSDDGLESSSLVCVDIDRGVLHSSSSSSSLTSGMVVVVKFSDVRLGNCETADGCCIAPVACEIWPGRWSRTAASSFAKLEYCRFRDGGRVERVNDCVAMSTGFPAIHGESFQYRLRLLMYPSTEAQGLFSCRTETIALRSLNRGPTTLTTQRRSLPISPLTSFEYDGGCAPAETRKFLGKHKDVVVPYFMALARGPDIFDLFNRAGGPIDRFG